MTTEEKFKIDSNYPGIIKWGGFSLFISGIIAIIFFILVISTQQTLPIPAKETLENPFRPGALFTLAIFGELLLLPGGLALYFSLRSSHKNSMIIAASIWILCVPMFLASRGLILAISQISRRYLETSSEIIKASYVASAEMAIETQNLYAMMGLILLSIASIIMGTIMLKVKKPFGKIGYSVVIAGLCTLLGAISVVVKEVPIIFPIIGVIMTAGWQFYIGLKLFQLKESA